MEILYIIIFFILGSVMGSFYAVIGDRLPKKENFTTSRSHCDSCGHELKFYDMIPIISYIIYKGRCRYCKKKIPVIVFLSELFTGVLFAVSYYSFSFSLDLLIALGVVSLLVIVIVSDVTYFVIPDEVLIFFSIYFIVIDLLNIGFIDTLKRIGGGLFLFALMYLISVLGKIIFKKEALGGGDVKLMFVFGLVLEPLLGVTSIFLGSLIALPVAIVILVTNREHMIPFGPFLLIAFAIIYFTKIDSNDLINLITLDRLYSTKKFFEKVF